MIPGQPQLDDQGRCAINASGQPQCSPDGSCCCATGGGEVCFAHYVGCASGFDHVSIRYRDGCPPVHPPVIYWLAGDPTHRCFSFVGESSTSIGLVLQPAEILATFQTCIECDPPPPPTGGCCLPDGSCVNTTAAQCGNFNGNFLGVGQFCGSTQCPPPVDPLGACCRPDGTCNERTQSSCVSAGFTWLGPNTSCTPNPCPGPQMHSCCIAGQCFNQDEPTCQSNGGLYRGAVQCGQAQACPGFNEVGPCCTPGGECFQGTNTQCINAGGQWLGPGHTCFDCPPPGSPRYAQRPTPGIAEAFNWAKAFATAGRVSDEVRQEREATCATCEYARQDDRGLWCSQCGCGTSDDSRRIFNLAAYNEGPSHEYEVQGTRISLPQWGCKHPQRGAGKGWRR